MSTRRRTAVTAVCLAALLGPIAACSSSSEPEEQTLRIAMGSPGEAQIRVWNQAGEEFEKSHDNVTVEFNFQDDDLYQTIGLPNLLSGKNAPDIYFEWTGNRMNIRHDDGYAADLTDAVANGPLAGLFDDEAFGPAKIDGKISMVPMTEDVTNVMWYNTEIFAEHSIAPPQTWDELLQACQTLDAAGITPIASGNKDLWAAGNWLSHVTSRVVGEDVYSATLSGEQSFDTPEWIGAFDRVKDLADNNCVNRDINSIDDNMGAQLFFQGRAAMHAIGSWLVSWAIDEAPDLDFDYFNLPAIDGAGDQGSVMGVVTGYMVNAKSSEEMQGLAAEFLALVNSEEYLQPWLEAELTPMTKAAESAGDQDARTLAMTDLLQTAPAIVLPPDTGYDLKVADALYEGLAAVIGGQSTPEEAVAEIDRKVG